MLSRLIRLGIEVNRLAIERINSDKITLVRRRLNTKLIHVIKQHFWNTGCMNPISIIVHLPEPDRIV